jgi:hypothetical protein
MIYTSITIKILLIFSLLVLSVKCNTEQKIMSAVVAPEMAAALEIAEKIKTTHKREISDIKGSSGFLELKITSFFEKSDILSENLDLIIKYSIDDLEGNKLPENIKKSISRSLKLKTLALIKIKNNVIVYDLAFNDGEGKLFYINFEFEPHPTVNNAIIWKRYFWISKVKPSPQYIVVSSSDCDIFSCDYEQHIEYLPAVLTQNHIEELMNINKMFFLLM